MRYEIIVTDVTCYGRLFCVAGWDRNAGGMIRPEPPDVNPAYEATRFWPAQFAGPGTYFSVGNIVSIEAALPPANFPFPHATEDRVVAANQPIVVTGQLPLPEVVAAVAAGVSPGLPAAFDGGLVRAPSTKAYVQIGYQGRSLGALMVAADQINFYIDDYIEARPKLRAVITSGNISYDLSVTAAATRVRWQLAGLAGLRADLQASHNVHVRLGLSRPFAERPNECYAQVNGVYFL